MLTDERFSYIRQTLILDEPTSGLDVESRRKLWDLLLVRSYSNFSVVRKNAEGKTDCKNNESREQKSSRKIDRKKFIVG